MQTIPREKLLNALSAVSPGLDRREGIEQSSCFVFKDGKVMTYNEEVFCVKTLPLKFSGAVQAQSVLDLLNKIKDESIDILMEDGKEGAPEFVLKTKRGKAGIRFEAAVILPVDKINIPTEWTDLPSDFAEAINQTQACASSEEDQFALTCIHVAPGHIEACDRKQIARYTIKTKFPVSVLIKRKAAKQITQIGMTQFSLTKEWVWFRNPFNLNVAVRRHTDPYINLDKFLILDNAKEVNLPKSLTEIADICSIFSEQSANESAITVTLMPGKIRLRGEGVTGWYTEYRKVEYSGPKMQFLATSELLKTVLKASSKCEITENKLKVISGKVQYVVTLAQKVEDLPVSEKKPKEKSKDMGGRSGDDTEVPF